MLTDKDRIFSNLYGQGDWGLEGARRRGSWNGTKDLLDKGRDWLTKRSPRGRGRGRAGSRPASNGASCPSHDGRRTISSSMPTIEPGTCKDRETAP